MRVANGGNYVGIGGTVNSNTNSPRLQVQGRMSVGSAFASAQPSAANSLIVEDALGVATNNPVYSLDVSTRNLADAYVARLGENGVLISTGGAVQTTGKGYGEIDGDPRGTGAVDLQTSRALSDQVASGGYAVIGGGTSGRASGTHSTVSGGYENTAGGGHSVVSGGSGNTAAGDYSAVSGGTNNYASNFYSFVGGGWGNVADPSTVNAAAVLGGVSNKAQAGRSAVGGGGYNVVTGSNSFIGGGAYNAVVGTSAVVAGGETNQAGGMYSFVGGGDRNEANGRLTAIAGGIYQVANGERSFLGGGAFNTVDAQYGVIAGGSDNKMPGSSSGFIGGGSQNMVAGDYSVIPGGYQNAAIYNLSFAAGHRSTAAATGSFAWNDAYGDSLVNDVPNQVRFKAVGGFWVSTSTVYGDAGLFVTPQNNVAVGLTDSLGARLAVVDKAPLGIGSNPYLVKVGTGTVPDMMAVSTMGVVSMPMQSSVVADLPSFSLSNSGWTVLAGMTEWRDTQNEFFSNQFKAAAPGMYMVSAHLQMLGGYGSGSKRGLGISVNGALAPPTYFSTKPPEAGAPEALTISYAVRLNAGDTVDLCGFQDTAGAFNVSGKLSVVKLN
jgi:hypothetical protein